MALICTPTSLLANSAPLRALSLHELNAAEVYWLWLHKNPSTPVNTVGPAATLLAQAQCFSCAAGLSSQSKVMEQCVAFLERQAAIDAGASVAALNVNTVRRVITPLCNLSDAQLQMIEVLLRCQLA